MGPEQLVKEHPVVFHMAEDGTWPSIRTQGLLSTRALVDLYQPAFAVSEAILNTVRRSRIVLARSGLAPAVIRDQLPLKYLEQGLTDGTTPKEYLALLNGRVFFWLTRERLSRLLRARQYRSHPHLVLCLDTAELLRCHGKNVQLAPYNTGSMLRPPPYSPRRGSDVFVDIDEYPYDRWRRQRGLRGDAVVELTVDYAVPDAAELVLRVERWEGGACTEILLKR